MRRFFRPTFRRPLLRRVAMNASTWLLNIGRLVGFCSRFGSDADKYAVEATALVELAGARVAG